jgi:hypothetical protein
LRNHEQPRTRLLRLQPRTEVDKHGSTIMRDEDPAFLCGSLKDLRIAYARQARIGSRSEVDSGFAPAHCLDDGVTKVGVRL